MKTLVVGAGKTGIAAANRLVSLGHDVTLTDSKETSELKDRTVGLHGSVKLIAGKNCKIEPADYAMAITSPGIPWDNNLLESLRKTTVPVISEIEAAFRYLNQDWVAVTGTNGKTTTTSLVGAMLKESGISSVVCGNIGNPVIGEDELFESPKTVVAEISSFQLEGVTTFAPKVAAILNITPDHLDRHGDMENYKSIKCRIFEKQSKTDFCVLNMDDPQTEELSQKVSSRLFGFSSMKALNNGAFLAERRVNLADGGKREELCNASEIRLLGNANLENALAACAISYCAGARASAIRKVLLEFEGLPHRMEEVGVVDGVSYINDSKATNVHATLKGIEGIDAPFYIILGGRDKGGDFAPLAEMVANKGAKAILIGEAADKISSSFKGYEKVFRAESLNEAVSLAASDPENARGKVILSPACASFDMFENYEERGEKFREAVRNLKTNHGAVNA